jgi:predicted  nucleic acid-binding Zn-ribbon protein
MDAENATATPGDNNNALRQLSAEQMNQQRIPQSPSLHSYLAENDRPRHRPRDSTSSDVQAKVAMLNSLSNPSSPVRGPRSIAANTHNPAFQRALLGYEESQASLATARAEIDRLKQQLESGQRRERMVSERIESLMDQLATARESRESDKKAYVAEIKKSRKQGYQAEMSAMEAREEVKETKTELKKVQNELEKEKKKKEEARQEAFERAYAVSGLTEEMESLKQTIKALERERDAAVVESQTSLLQKQEALLTIERSVQTEPQAPKHTEDVDATPRPSKRARTVKVDHSCRDAPSTVDMPFRSEWVDFKAYERNLDGEQLTLEDHINALYGELRYTNRMIEKQKDEINFMNIQCQFKACPCRDAERLGIRFVHDVAYDRKLQEQNAAKKRKFEEDEKFKQLPPDPCAQDFAKAADEHSVTEAVSVPLPSPKAKELDSQGPTPEATAVLEEMTQVLVEPVQDNEHFKFSTRGDEITAMEPPPLRHANSATEAIETDLFNLSPPKHAPPRPSTALGMTTPQSPIRLVPDSPQTLPPRSTTSHDVYATSSTTTRVALKDTSPVRTHRRAQSRPNIRDHSRPRSPLVTAKSNPDFKKSTSASPAANTLFPITPITKHPRPQPQQHVNQTVTTTTLVPLRGFETDEDISQLSQASSHAFHTQPVTLPSQGAHHAPEQMINAPGTPVSREAALAQIRARRDRARSVNLKKEANGVKSAPGSARRGIALREAIERGRDARDVSVASMASAPGRI